MDVKAAIGIGTGALALVAGLFAFDARYMHAEAAEKAFVQQSQDLFRARLELELEQKQHELEFLESLEDPDQSVLRKIKYLEQRIDNIEEELLDLEAAD